ncbi:zinc finger CCCH domain-containing protein 15 homolog [Exaiptasia diaphana]|uniref:C3H1-type domain-containing protein n=1 Tax=Exaiptasia diaphana TaxID=2652724 RepID=A0A913WR49_EXADI|nr:zinc finger CCCH domain-containing protein 15 homolog [Exaiptasia diaphana]KXJ18607.1 Zinc finger CCCH domain-containing protein 15 [Exaiptasia diaphana]
MPPKKKGGEASKKNIEKKKDKVIEDKTFGLKNKKGKKQQDYVKQVTQQVKYGGNPSARKLQQDQDKKKIEAEAKKKEKDEANKLFKPVITQKISAGADPRSVVCAFFKQGQCSKGDKCKFSHDLSLDRKGEKRSLYVDQRDAEEDLKNDTMDKWDQQKLEEVIEKKHGAKEKCMPKTEIVCKYFLEAVEKNLYGWFWSCPNGNKCIYRHALPPGFILKKKEQKEDKEEISIEEFIETERQKLGPNLTKITLETFLQWKQRKLKEKKEAYEKEQEKKKDDFKSGRIVGKVSGREVFQFKPELVGEDADDEGETEDISIYRKKDEDEEEVNVVDVSVEAMAAAAREADGSGSIAKERITEKQQTNGVPDTKDADVNGLNEACGGTTSENAQESPPVVDGIPIEESLFDEDIDELELDELEIAD